MFCTPHIIIIILFEAKNQGGSYLLYPSHEEKERRTPKGHGHISPDRCNPWAMVAFSHLPVCMKS